MAFFRRTQKQVTERLAGNLTYYNKGSALRQARFWVSLLVLLAGVAAIPAYYHFRAPEAFMNPGPISYAHAAIANRCDACHPQTSMISVNPRRVGQILRTEPFVPLDQACAQCHQRYLFHVPNTVPDSTRPAGTGAQFETTSCTSCHQEHRTSGKMLPATDATCAACHNRRDLMAASSQAGHVISPNFFPTGVPRRTGGLLFFYKPRPPEGYTATFAAFDQGHPGFQIHTQHLQDPDTLKYNHARHELSDVRLDGAKLSCNYCHQADATGTNFRKITFENNCVRCHALTFDPNVPASNEPDNPGLVIPHGDPDKVRSYLRTLPIQYLEYATRHDGATGPQAQAFMAAAIPKLAASYGVSPNQLAELGPKLEQKVFYNAEHVTTGAAALSARAGGGGGRGQDSTYFPGCAFCHEVSRPPPNVAPTITPARIFDRWLGDGNFDHSKHQQQTCAECHSSIHSSTLTSDINIPTQQSCTQCHNSRPGGVANGCQSCHHYHNDPGRTTLRSPAGASLPGTTGPTKGKSTDESILRTILLTHR